MHPLTQDLPVPAINHPATPCPASEPLTQFAERTLVIIPAQNEEECIGGVVKSLRDLGFHHIRVVENASRDRTGEVARAAGAEVLTDPRSGYGLACWLGGIDPPPEIEWLLYCNGDASDDLEALTQFAELADGHDLLLGNRNRLEDRRCMSAPQRFGNWLAPALIHLLWGYRFHDLGPQRAIRVEAYERLGMRDRGFGWTVEMQVRAVEEGLRIQELPVRSFPRPAGKSKISGNLRGTVMAGTIILKTIGNLAWRRARGAETSRTATTRFTALP